MVLLRHLNFELDFSFLFSAFESAAFAFSGS
jgi:hypothetical protein